MVTFIQGDRILCLRLDRQIFDDDDDDDDDKNKNNNNNNNNKDAENSFVGNSKDLKEGVGKVKEKE